MKAKRPKTILLLQLMFGWSFLRGLDLLIRGSGTADRVLYDAVGLGWLVVSLLVVIVMFDLAAIRYLIKPAPRGLVVCLASIGLAAFETSLAFAITRVHPDVARQALIVSRESRGLTVRTDLVDAFVDPTMSLMLWLVSLGFSAVWAFLVIRNAGYFVGTSAQPVATPTGPASHPAGAS